MPVLSTPPNWLQNESYDANNDRLMLAGFIQSSGLAKPTHFGVSATSTPSMTVNVGSGHAFIYGTSIANQGVYHVFNEGLVPVVLDPPDGTFPRIDLIVLRVRDSDVTGTDDYAEVTFIKGSASGSTPVAPSINTPNTIELARVTVGAASNSTISTANISGVGRTIARFNEQMGGGAVPTTSSARTPNPYVGQTILESDTGRLLFYNALGQWNYVGNRIVQEYAAPGGIQADGAVLIANHSYPAWPCESVMFVDVFGQAGFAAGTSLVATNVALANGYTAIGGNNNPQPVQANAAQFTTVGTSFYVPIAAGAAGSQFGVVAECTPSAYFRVTRKLTRIPIGSY